MASQATLVRAAASLPKAVQLRVVQVVAEGRVDEDVVDAGIGQHRQRSRLDPQLTKLPRASGW